MTMIKNVPPWLAVDSDALTEVERLSARLVGEPVPITFAGAGSYRACFSDGHFAYKVSRGNHPKEAVNLYEFAAYIALRDKEMHPLLRIPATDLHVFDSPAGIFTVIVMEYVPENDCEYGDENERTEAVKFIHGLGAYDSWGQNLRWDGEHFWTVDMGNFFGLAAEVGVGDGTSMTHIPYF